MSMLDEISITGSTDTELLARYTADGDQQAFAELVERYQPMVQRVCRRVIQSNYEADDAVQQVFLALSMKAVELQDRPSAASWLYRVAWNIASKTRRAMKTRQNYESRARTELPCTAPTDHPEPDTLLILQQALAEIPEMQREAIVLHYFCGYTTAEVAARLRCPAGTVAARVSRGLHLLRSKLSDRGLIITAVAVKGLMLGMMGGSKPAAAAILPKGGLPRLRVPLPRPRMPGLRFVRFAPVAALAPILASLGLAWGRTPDPSAAPITGTGSALASAIMQFFGRFAAFRFTWSRPAGGLLISLLCAGAGTATIGAAAAVADKMSDWASLTPDLTSNNSGWKPAPKTIRQSDDDKSGAASPARVLTASPVPEPGSAALLAGGAALLLGRRRSCTS